MIDTHSHIYDSAFDADRDLCIARDRQAGVEAVLLPAIDSSSHEAMMRLCRTYPSYFYPMMGLHPTSVNDIDDWGGEVDIVESILANPPVERIYALGEVGLDLYWSREREAQQVEAFHRQIELSIRYRLPLVIHTRQAWPQMHAALERYASRGISGVMHAFSGGPDDYRRVKEYGDFVFGIGGVLTYKNSDLAATLAWIDVQDMVLESDAPYLAPVPMRGRRNESGLMRHTLARIAEIKGMSPDEAERITTANAQRIFRI